ncbi:MAG: hypothetical protein ACKO6B_18045 [Planctomycetia bacterium]
MKSMDDWGVTGWANSWTALGSDVPDDEDDQSVPLDGYGVQRTVDPGVTYVAPPDVAGVPRWHQKRQSRGRIFEMVWPEDRLPKTRSLLEIQAAIMSRRPGVGAEDPDLIALDQAVDLLLSTAESLHAADASIGFLQPNSCRFGEWRSGDPYVMLPDVGFAWDKKVGLMMPAWISEPALGLLFENGAERRNEEYLAELGRKGDDRDGRKRAPDGATRELADVKILARLVATALVGADEIRRWCGDKKCLLKLPAKDVAHDTQAEIWDKVVAPALAGQFATVRELRSALATYKPSTHFLHRPPPAPWAGWSALRRSAMVAVAAAVIGLLWAFSGPIIEWFRGRPAPFCRNVAEDSPLYGRLFELEKAQKAARSDVASRPAYWAMLKERCSDHAALKTCRADCLAGLVDEWVLQAEEEGQAVRERLRARPRPTPEEVQDISGAIVAIRQATAEAKRQSRSGVEAMLERELRLRGGKLLTVVGGAAQAATE